MKKTLAILVALMILVLPVAAMAANDGVFGATIKKEGEAEARSDSFYMLPEAAADDGEGEVNPDPIPAAGPAVLTGLALVLATLGCAVVSKK